MNQGQSEEHSEVAGGNGVNAAVLPAEETVQEQYSLTGLKQQHQEQKGGLEVMLKGLYRENGTQPPTKELEKNDKKLRESGINIDHVPEFLRPAYIKVVNLIQSPTTRIEKNKSGVDDLVTQLESVEEEVTKTLYGPNYTGLSGKLGGLRKEIQVTADERHKTARAIDRLGNEIKETYQRIKKTTTALGTETDPEKIKEINDHLIGYHFDLERYEGIKQDLEGNIKGYKSTIKSLRQDIQVATHFRNYVRDVAQKARNALKVHQSSRSQVGYTELVSQLIPALQQRLGEYLGMMGDFTEKSNSEISYVVGVTQKSFDVPMPDDDGPSPFEGMLVANEKRSEEVSREVKEILKDPYGDIYKMGS